MNLLIQEGFLVKTSRGRKVTAKAYEALGIKLNTQISLFDDVDNN